MSLRYNKKYMDKAKIERRVARGAARWYASRLKPVVQKLGSKKVKKPKAKAGKRRSKKK